MTSTADTPQHPDVAEIADFTEGLLSSSRTADIQHHLNSCAPCAGIRDSLEEIRELLGTLPEPERMPADIVDRIDAALVSVRLDPSPPEDSADVSRETPPASHVRGSTPGGRPAGRPQGNTGPGREHGVRRRRRAVAFGAAFGAAVIGIGVFFLQASQPGSDPSSAESSADNGASVFAEPGLQSQVDSLLATSSATATGSSPQEKKAPSAQLDSSPNTLKRGTDVVVPSCIEKGIGRQESPLGAQKGTYNGAAAFLVVLPYPSDSRRVQAYVVDASCVDAAPPARGRVLLTHTYPRH